MLKSVLFLSKKPVKLSVNQTNFIEIPPRELVTYSKETQTPATDKPADKETKPVDYYGKLLILS